MALPPIVTGVELPTGVYLGIGGFILGLALYCYVAKEGRAGCSRVGLQTLFVTVGKVPGWVKGKRRTKKFGACSFSIVEPVRYMRKWSVALERIIAIGSSLMWV